MRERNARMTGSKGSDVVSECERKEGRKYRETQVGRGLEEEVEIRVKEYCKALSLTYLYPVPTVFLSSRL